MNPSGIFRISVLQGGLLLREHLNAYPGFLPEDAIRQLQSGPLAYARYDYESAVEIAKVHGWDIFPIVESKGAGLRSAIAALAKRLNPFWARMSVLGREKVRGLLDSDQEQCLRDARLLDTPIDALSLVWWDDLAAHFRAQQQELLNQIGRRAEELTIEYERSELSRLGIVKEPVWVALEDNTAGYDILSYRRRDSEVYRIFIEVKGSTTSPVRFFVSRNEWDEAVNLGDSYFFHVWDTTKAEVTIVPMESLSEHIPVDRGNGRWTKAEFASDGTFISFA